jgi:hypothetical protein
MQAQGMYAEGEVLFYLFNYTVELKKKKLVYIALHMNIMNVIFKAKHLPVPDFLQLNSSGKFTLSQAMKTQRGSRSISLFFL